MPTFKYIYGKNFEFKIIIFQQNQISQNKQKQLQNLSVLWVFKKTNIYYGKNVIVTIFNIFKYYYQINAYYWVHCNFRA